MKCTLFSKVYETTANSPAEPFIKTTQHSSLFYDRHMNEQATLSPMRSVSVRKTILHRMEWHQTIILRSVLCTLHRVGTRKQYLFGEKNHFCAIKSVTLTIRNPQFPVVMFVSRTAFSILSNLYLPCFCMRCFVLEQ